MRAWPRQVLYTFIAEHSQCYLQTHSFKEIIVCETLRWLSQANSFFDVLYREVRVEKNPVLGVPSLEGVLPAVRLYRPTYLRRSGRCFLHAQAAELSFLHTNAAKCSFFILTQISF